MRVMVLILMLISFGMFGEGIPGYETSCGDPGSDGTECHLGVNSHDCTVCINGAWSDIGKKCGNEGGTAVRPWCSVLQAARG